MHGLLDLIHVGLEHVGLSSRTVSALRVAGKREECGKLVPSEAEFLVECISASFVAANISAREWHSKHLRAEDACETIVEGIPASFVVGVSLSWSILASASEAASRKNEWTLVIVLLCTVLSSLHHTMAIEGMDIILVDLASRQIVSSIQRQTELIVVADLLELRNEGKLVGGVLS